MRAYGLSARSGDRFCWLSLVRKGTHRRRYVQASLRASSTHLEPHQASAASTLRCTADDHCQSDEASSHQAADPIPARSTLFFKETPVDYENGNARGVRAKTGGRQ